MQAAFSIGASGLSAYQDKLDSAGSNIANIDTTAYKPEETAFRDLIYNKMSVNSSSAPLSGQGVSLTVTGIDASPGGLIPTGRSLDLAVDGEGWFALETPNGKQYTRDGSFTLSESDGNAYLVNRAGYYVLDSSGQRISEPESDGAALDAGSMTARAGVFGFSVPSALTPMSGNCYAENSFSGQAKALPDGKAMSGYLEESKVLLSDEMVNLITSQRSYQLSARVVQTADEIAQTVNSLRA